MIKSNGRVCRTNGLLLAAYFVPVWVFASLKIIISPLHGLYTRPNIAPSLFMNDQFQLSMLGTVRFAWLLAAAKLVVAAFFALSAALSIRAIVFKKGDGEEALGFALVLGAIVSFASMVMARHVGEPVSVHLHATETLMLLGGLIILAVDSRNYGLPEKVPAVQAQPVEQAI